MRLDNSDISYINEAILNIRPNSSWSSTPEGEITEWRDAAKTDEPTQAEIDTEVTRLKAEYTAQEYSINRKAEYDALNQFELISDDANNGTTTHIDAVNAIKTKYPKP
jgi:uncharacterized protein YbaA (DUF1428 family)